MLNSELCLTEAEPFFSIGDNTELGDKSPSSIHCESITKSDCSHANQISNLAQNEKCSKQTRSLIDGVVLRKVSRKREASNILMDSGKRKDNTKNFNFHLNVPSLNYSQDIPMQNELINELSLLVDADGSEFQNVCSADCSDSVSLSDSGIGTSSKGSSPSHSIEILNNQEDGVDDYTSVSMEVDEGVTASGFNQNPSLVCKSNPSPVLIYEDLHDLHLTDQAVQQKHTIPKSPISNSLFSHVAPTIYFASNDEEVSPMPSLVLPLLKWKLSTITPVLIKEIVQKSGFVLLDANTSEEWLGTWGKHLKCNAFRKIKTYQKVNHYPGSFHLGRKDKLWENYKRMQSCHGIDAFNFFPETFHLPRDINLLKNIWDTYDEKCWIIKPPASARGTGVKVIYKWSQIPKNKPIMVQRYLSDPYLINGTKFDLRIYVFVSSIDPLRIYMFDDGLVRFASEKYSVSNKSFSNRFVHLTNYSINRKSSSYTANDDENLCQGHKWTLKTFWSYMENCGINIEKIKGSIKDMILKTVICAEGPICRLIRTYAKTTYSCYELFGFDIMLDKDLRAWLLEVNISPSLHIRSTLDAKIKGPMVKDMLNMAAFLVPEKKTSPEHADYGIMCPVANKHKALRNRCLSHVEQEKHSVNTLDYEKYDILTDLTPDDIRCLIESEDEYNRRGSFVRIFPSAQSSKYFKYFEHNRYYNLLLDAWEKKYHDKRKEGISLLQDYCDKRYHLQAVVKEHSNSVNSALTDEQEIEITVH